LIALSSPWASPTVIQIKLLQSFRVDCIIISMGFAHGYSD